MGKTMLKTCWMILLVSLAAVFAGCRKENDEAKFSASLAPGVHYGEGMETLVNLPPEAVLLRVNGVPFTRKDFEIDQEVYCKLSSFIRTGSVEGDTRDMEKLKSLRAPKLLNTVLRRELLNQEAHRRNLKASDAAVSARRKELETAISSASAGTNGTIVIEDLARKMGPECERYFLDNLRKDAENLELSWLIAGDRLKISEADVTAASNRLAKANEFVASTNAVLKARLLDALKRVQAGEDFAAVGSELSMFDKDEAKEWGTFTIEDFEDDTYPEVAEFLKTSPEPGSVGGPFQCDDGVSIVKVLSVERDAEEKEDEGADAEEDKSDDTRYKLARISVETFEYHKSLTREEIRKILEDDRRKKSDAAFGQHLFEAAVIEFPSGTNLFAFAASNSGQGGDLKNKRMETHKGEGGEDVE